MHGCVRACVDACARVCIYPAPAAQGAERKREDEKKTMLCKCESWRCHRPRCRCGTRSETRWPRPRREGDAIFIIVVVIIVIIIIVIIISIINNNIIIIIYDFPLIKKR